jgi:hypothetical protein
MPTTEEVWKKLKAMLDNGINEDKTEMLVIVERKLEEENVSGTNFILHTKVRKGSGNNEETNNAIENAE